MATANSTRSWMSLSSTFRHVPRQTAPPSGNATLQKDKDVLISHRSAGTRQNRGLIADGHDGEQKFYTVRCLIARTRISILLSTVLGMALSALPADAARRCSNALADGRFIVQGPLVDEFGESCSFAVVPRPRSSFSTPMLTDRAQFSDQIIILSPPFAHRPRRVTIVESSEFDRSREVERSRQLRFQRFASPTVPRRPFVPFTTGSLGPFTTGTLGPFTTSSNSRPGFGAAIGTSPTVRGGHR
jgi:hypothetical protein